VNWFVKVVILIPVLFPGTWNSVAQLINRVTFSVRMNLRLTCLKETHL